MINWKNILIIMLATAFITTFFLLNQSQDDHLKTIKDMNKMFLENESFKKSSQQNLLLTVQSTKSRIYDTITYCLNTNIPLNNQKLIHEYEGYPNRNLQKNLLFVNTRLVPCESFSGADVVILLEKHLENISVKIIDTHTQQNIYFNSREVINLWKYESLILAFYDKEINNYQSAISEK